MTNFPAVNNKEVSAAPIQTSLQAILVLGRSLKIIANRTVIESRERRKSRDSNKTAGIGSMSPRYFVTATRSTLRKSQASNCNRDDQEGGQGKNGVISQRCAHPRRFVLVPFQTGGFEQRGNRPRPKEQTHSAPSLDLQSPFVL